MRKEFDAEVELEQPEDISEKGRVFPATVRIAGIVWMVMGTVIILNGVWSLGIPAEGVNANGLNAGVVCAASLALLFGIAFIFVGQQTLRGTAKDTFGNAIGSLFIGIAPLVYGFATLVTGLEAANMPADIRNASLEIASANVELLIFVGAVYFVSGMGLLTAGTFAIIGRSEYRKWRLWQHNTKPRELV
jgi:hypothetical protein